MTIMSHETHARIQARIDYDTLSKRLIYKHIRRAELFAGRKPAYILNRYTAEINILTKRRDALEERINAMG